MYSKFRSFLYIPANQINLLEKAQKFAADVIIIDLEDSVPILEKPICRDNLPSLLERLNFGDSQLLLRINPSNSDWFDADIELSHHLNIQGIVLPKSESATQIRTVGKIISHTQTLWPLIESPKGVLASAEIATASQRVEGLILGHQNLATTLGLRGNNIREGLIFALQNILISARAAGILAVDSPCAEFQELTDLIAECKTATQLGFDGKAGIHPNQLATINAWFSPSEKEINHARAVIYTWRQAEQAGYNVASLNGHMIDRLHVVRAQHVLEKAGCGLLNPPRKAS